MSKQKTRKPTSFRVEDVEVIAMPSVATEPALPAPRIRNVPALERGLRWGSILLGAVCGLVTMAATVWLYDWALALIARQDMIGWIAVGLLSLAVLALVMIVLREIAGLMRLRRLDHLRHEADSATRQNDKALALDVAQRLKRLYAGRNDMEWGLAGFAAALVDMLFVGGQNLRMLRRLATLYGARPGTLSLLKLARMVLTHIVLTGGIALGDDVIHQLVGHGLTAKLSARLGEGLFNGALTTRIGLATIDVCRPLPYIDVPRPRFRELVAEVAGLNS